MGMAAILLNGAELFEQIIHRKIKHQGRAIILPILEDLLSSMICAKIRPQGLFGSGEEDF